MIENNKACRICSKITEEEKTTCTYWDESACLTKDRAIIILLNALCGWD